MQELSAKICLIAPSQTLAQNAKAISERLNMNILVSVADLESAVELARKLLSESDYIFISRRGTRALLETSLNIPIVSIPSETSDYLPALRQLRNEEGLIALFSSAEEISNDLQVICSLLGLKMRLYRFTDSASCQQAVLSAIADGAVWGVGGAVTERSAKEYGLPYIIVESSDAAILHALESAYQMYLSRQESAHRQEQLQIQLERYQNILDYTHDAVIAIDENGLISAANRIAEKMLRSAKPPFTGRPIEEVLHNTHMNAVLRTGEAEIDQMMDIHGTLVSTNRVPIIVSGKVKGVVATFQDIKSLQTAERSIRIKMHEKGLVAKYKFSDIIGHSRSLSEAKSLCENFADSDFTVMLYGETGTGKEMFAQSIHNASPRRDGPFVAINCTALSRDLLESELFGYSDSSFTGARRGGKAGLFETAHGGTVFLDEIGELPLEFQAQFLRVLQEKEVRRIGDDMVIPVDVRVIGATNKNLMELVEAGKFRRDLYYRINVLSVYIPPLRERGDDYLELAKVIFARTAPSFGQNEPSFMRILKFYKDYQWPGNVRELTNVVERASLLLKRGLPEERVLRLLQESSMPLRSGIAAQTEPEQGDPEQFAQAERERILATLKKTGGNVTRAAKLLGISRSTLYRKLRRDL